MRDDRLDVHQAEHGRRDRDHDDVVRGRGDAAAHQHADHGRQDQREQQRQRVQAHDLERQDRQPARHVLRPARRDAGDHVGDLEPDPGQGHDADHHAHQRRGGGDRQRLLGAQLEAFVDAVRGALQPLGQALGRKLLPQKDRDAGRDRPEGGGEGRAARHQHRDQQDQRHEREPALPQHLPRVRQFGRMKAAQPQSLGFQVDLHQHPEEVHEGGHDGGDQDRGQRQAEILDHQERDRSHDRGRDLPAGRGRGLDRRGEVAGIAHADHRGDRQRPGRDGVGDGRPRDRPQHRRGQHRHLGRPPGIAPGEGRGHVDEQLPQPDPCRHDPEQDEVEHVGRDHAERGAVDALARQVQVVDDVGPARAGMDEDAGHVLAEIGVGHEQDGDDRQRPSHRPAHGLQQDDDQGRAHQDVGGRGVADPERQLVVDPRHVERRGRAGDRQQPVHQRQAQQRQRPARDLLPAEGGKGHEDEEGRRGKVKPAMDRRLRDAEPGGVVVIAAQQEQDHAREDGDRAHQIPEPHLGVVFLLDRGELIGAQNVGRVVAGGAGVGHVVVLNEEGPQAAMRLRAGAGGLTGSARLRDRSARRPDAAAGPGPRSRSPSRSSCPWRGPRPAACASRRSRPPW